MRFVCDIIRNKQLRAHLVSEANDNTPTDFEITTDVELGRLKQDILVSEQQACDREQYCMTPVIRWFYTVDNKYLVE